MKPIEFWNAEYREIIKYCDMNYLKSLDDLKTQIMLEDASTNKVIKSNPMLYKRPKVQSLKEVFKKIFE